jgi:pyruvate ferredoxin oxidoreductase gamma subunit
MVCPDYCFVWEQGVDKRGRPAMVLKGIDYQYCKGCLKCVEACPTDALQDLREEDGYAAAHTVRHTKLFGLGR